MSAVFFLAKALGYLFLPLLRSEKIQEKPGAISMARKLVEGVWALPQADLCAICLAPLFPCSAILGIFLKFFVNLNLLICEMGSVVLFARSP